MTTLYHATSKGNISSIATTNLRAGSYWTNNLDVLNYYKETISDDRESPVVLSISLNELVDKVKSIGATLEPDNPGLDEPITSAVGMSEHQIWQAWQKTKGTWQDCLELIGSIRCPVEIPATLLMVDGEFGAHALVTNPTEIIGKKVAKKASLSM